MSQKRSGKSAVSLSWLLSWADWSAVALVLKRLPVSFFTGRKRRQIATALFQAERQCFAAKRGVRRWLFAEGEKNAHPSNYHYPSKQNQPSKQGWPVRSNWF
jgi:hypothetical protein